MTNLVMGKTQLNKTAPMHIILEKRWKCNSSIDFAKKQGIGGTLGTVEMKIYGFVFRVLKLDDIYSCPCRTGTGANKIIRGAFLAQS